MLINQKIVNARTMECRRMKMKNNVVGWFEIPVTDMERSIRFYEQVFDFKLSRLQIGSLEMAWFPMVEGGIGTPGSLVKLLNFISGRICQKTRSMYYRLFSIFATKIRYHKDDQTTINFLVQLES